jgi:hypothetical protein
VPGKAKENDMITTSHWKRARDFVAGLAMVAFGVSSILGLSGCRAVEAIFKVGAWFGALVVIAIVAVIGGIIAMVARK